MPGKFKVVSTIFLFIFVFGACSLIEGGGSAAAQEAKPAPPDSTKQVPAPQTQSAAGSSQGAAAPATGSAPMPSPAATPPESGSPAATSQQESKVGNQGGGAVSLNLENADLY